MPVNPYQKYKQQSIMTMTPGELLLKLYDESINQLRQAVGALGQKQYDKANAALQKAQRIISHLNKTLVMDYEISKNLEALYDFFIYKITQANIHKDAAQIEEILPMLQDLRDAYAQAEKNAAAEAHAAHG